MQLITITTTARDTQVSLVRNGAIVESRPVATLRDALEVAAAVVKVAATAGNPISGVWLDGTVLA